MTELKCAYQDNPKGHPLCLDFMFDGPKDNASFGSYEEDFEARLDRASHHVIQRRTGNVKWTPHKCIRCKAPYDPYEHVWLRFYSGVADEFYRVYSYNRLHVRLHEQCDACGRTTSWPYKGIAGQDWERVEFRYRKRDSQRQKCYEWQSNAMDRGSGYSSFMWEMFDWSKCLEYVDFLCQDWNVPTPKIIQGKGDKLSWMRGTELMSIIARHQCRRVLIHEAAHHLTFVMKTQLRSDRYGLPPEPGHGALFMRTYVEMLLKHGDPNVSRSTLEGTLSVYGLQITPREVWSAAINRTLELNLR